MLKSLDVLIGISLVMLIVSMVVTILTQFITTAVNSHGRNLKTGLQDLIAHLDPGLKREFAEKIAEAVLKHPLVGTPSLFPGLGPRLGAVVHRHEFTKILLELASGSSLDTATRGALTAALSATGITNPTDTLDNIRTVALSLEESSPQLASSLRADMAILEEAKSKFVGRINGWFDQTIDRVSERFTASARAITFVCGLILAFALQLDSINLLNTLWTSDIARQDLAARATDLVEQGAATLTPAEIKIDQQTVHSLSTFALDGLVVIPWGSAQNPTGWCKEWSGSKLPGILLSAFLLSLGAPFWYNALKSILKMRSDIAGKDDAQRLARQSQGPTGPVLSDRSTS